MRLLRQLVFVLILVLSGAVSRAQVMVTFDQNPISIGLGGTASFTGELRNTGVDTLFINGDSLNLAGSGLTSDDSAFLTNAPITLVPGAVTPSFAFFTITAANLSPLGGYTGTFSILGGLDGNATNDLSGTPPPAFQVNVVNPSAPNVPEPGNVALLSGIAMTGTGFFWRRSRRRKTYSLRLQEAIQEG